MNFINPSIPATRQAQPSFNEFLRTVPSKYDRVWIVLKNNETKTGTDPTTALINGLFGESYPHFDKQNFPWIEVRLYSKQ